VCHQSLTHFLRLARIRRNKALLWNPELYCQQAQYNKSTINRGASSFQGEPAWISLRQKLFFFLATNADSRGQGVYRVDRTTIHLIHFYLTKTGVSDFDWTNMWGFSIAHMWSLWKLVISFCVNAVSSKNEMQVTKFRFRANFTSSFVKILFFLNK